jgi:hypothetical protein
MKSILCALLLIFLVFVISCRKIELFKPYAEKVVINGIVSDTNNNLLDSVEIKLYKSTIMYPNLYIDEKYSNNGIFKFEFIPEEMWNYYLYFEKEGYRNEKYNVDETKEFQKCNIIMERAVE